MSALRKRSCFFLNSSFTGGDCGRGRDMMKGGEEEEEEDEDMKGQEGGKGRKEEESVGNGLGGNLNLVLGKTLITRFYGAISIIFFPTHGPFYRK